MPVLPAQCPFCGGPIEVRSFACSQCDAGVEGHFTPNRLTVLDAEQAQFVLVFVRNRGNIKEVERETGLSYPAVRAKLDDVIRALGFNVRADGEPSEEQRARRSEVLAALERGEINAAQAAERLKQP